MRVRWAARTHTKLCAHLLVDTRLELPVEINDRLEELPRVLVNLIQLVVACVGAIFLDVGHAGDSWTHKYRAEDHEHNGEDEEKDHVDGVADAAHRLGSTARAHDADAGDDDEDDAEDHDGLLLLDLLRNFSAGHFLGLGESRAKKNVESLVLADLHRKHHHDYAEDETEDGGQHHRLGTGLNRFLLHLTGCNISILQTKYFLLLIIIKLRVTS